MKLQASIAALLCVASSAVFADQIGLSLSNDTAQVDYTMPMSYSGYGRTDAKFGLLYTEADDVMMLGGIQMAGETGSHTPGLHGGVNVMGYGASMDNSIDVGSIALGGQVKFIPQEMSRVAFGAELNFGPDVTTFGDAEKFWAFSARAEYEVLPEAAVYVGYRRIKVRIENFGDVDLDKGWHLGLRMAF